MKKLFISLLFISVASVSCDSEDDGITYTTPDYLSGKWVFSEYGTINDQLYVVYQDYANEATCEADNLELKSDNTFVLSDFSSTLVGTNVVCESEVTNGVFSRENRELTLSYTDAGIEYEKVFTINALSYNEITLSTVNNLGETEFYKLTK